MRIEREIDSSLVSLYEGGTAIYEDETFVLVYEDYHEDDYDVLVYKSKSASTTLKIFIDERFGGRSAWLWEHVNKKERRSHLRKVTPKRRRNNACIR